MLTITFILPSGVKVKAKLKKPELQKIVEEAKLYQHQKPKRTIWQWVKLIWTRKVKVRWVRVREWVKRRIS